jgi:energy-coupling factor transport system ATP-binding protein
MEKIIEFKNVSFKYSEEETEVINDLSLDFYAGQFTCVLGHNGSGKSTLAKQFYEAFKGATNGTT